MTPKEVALIGGGAAVAAVAIAIAVMLPKSTPPAPSSAAAPTSTAVSAPPAPQHPDELAAIDVVRVLRAHYKTAQDIGSPDFAIAGCNDKSNGYQALVDCSTPHVEAIKAISAKATPAGVATSPCGKELETALATFITMTTTYNIDHYRWLLDSKARLAPAMAGKNVSDACERLGKFCDTRPRNYQPKYAKASTFEPIMSVNCVKTLFQCGPAGNVCWVNKIADRLGIGERAPASSGDLKVRATGRTIQ
jgi:hypothetical protein